MPLYDYVCPSCNFKKEVRHSYEENYEDYCPTCALKLNKTVGGMTFRLPSHGWSNTNYE